MAITNWFPQARVKDACIRAARTYITVAGPAFLALATNSVWDVAAWKVALMSGVPAALAFLWRLIVDPSPIPSMNPEGGSNQPALDINPPIDNGGA